MGDEEYDDLDDRDEDTDVVKSLRKAAREGRSAAKERDALARELAFSKAGVPSTVASSYFLKAYDGELTPEAIKAAAVEAGFLAESEGENANEVSDEERQAHERAASAAAGSEDAPPPGYAEEIAAAKNQAEVLAVMEKYGQQTVNAP